MILMPWNTSTDTSRAFASGGMRKFRFLTFRWWPSSCNFMLRTRSFASAAVPIFIPSTFISALKYIILTFLGLYLLIILIGNLSTYYSYWPRSIVLRRSYKSRELWWTRRLFLYLGKSFEGPYHHGAQRMSRSRGSDVATRPWRDREITVNFRLMSRQLSVYFSIHPFLSIFIAVYEFPEKNNE